MTDPRFTLHTLLAEWTGLLQDLTLRDGGEYRLCKAHVSELENVTGKRYARICLRRAGFTPDPTTPGDFLRRKFGGDRSKGVHLTIRDFPVAAFRDAKSILDPEGLIE